MPEEKNVAIMSNKAKILSVIDGKTQKTRINDKKASWVPASAGMTTGVGGTSH